ncbi:MAG: hypothetical protein N3D17_06520 [bacterium]|nr:hypothetical protein [bacterium]
MKKTNKLQFPVIIIFAFVAIFVLNYLNSRKTPSEQIEKLISQHRAAIVFVKSNTEKDVEFFDALKEARREMKGKGGIVIAGPEFLKNEGNPPLIITFDADGNFMGALSYPLDRAMFKEIIHSISTHSH